MRTNIFLQRALPFLMASALLVACHGGQRDQHASGGSVVTEAMPVAPVGRDAREGEWRESPVLDAVKDKAGIVMLYRINRGKPDEPLVVDLRFEGVHAADASVTVRVIDGAQFASKDQPEIWRLTPNAASEFSVPVKAPPGRSYMVLEMRQNGQFTSQSFALRMPKL